MDIFGIDITEWIWKSVIIVIAGTVLLRVAGRKSISQMTLAQTVIMIGIGSLLIQPLAGENIWSTLFVGSMLVITLIVVEYGQLKINSIEKLITGSSKILIEDGKLNLDNLRSVRLTVDQLETQLRLNKIANINDVKWATIEPNGQLGFQLKEQAKNSTKEDIQTLKVELQQVKQLLTQMVPAQASTVSYSTNQANYSNNSPIESLNKQLNDVKKQIQKLQNPKPNDLFEEVDKESHVKPPPEHLQ
ncbi:hypothetical protein JCM9140_3782 [Halalkalibacter wakoensis JCM 9140]|uniref:YetF C-terminal domain-containing protein n=1 Tax=Halalkalibacter wakoensis JCM 9140 TaxID=1236970 RepID=W4Q8B7_9BACI|nr:DUF421 domain-containing protein [Halalkalibacter wakoensis]GAE27629.1 hypothetical protein JCM9140_3782 [Halalkalibacter wakoensis JCM 9140]